MPIKKVSVNILFFVIVLSSVTAQQHLDPEYIKITNERAAKIVSELELVNADKKQVVTNIIAEQYRNLSKIHDERDAQIEQLEKSSLSNYEKNKKIEKLNKKTEKLIDKLHKSYLAQLAAQLNEEQIVVVKDGMTYGVVPLTYAGYIDMLPNLTEKQKKMIYDNLVEAREHAMDGGSSKEKHAWFGKYKGRINNKLSKEGYDLNEASKEWHKRIEGRKKEKQ